ncbi:hypothetical protein [Paenibacillus sp. 23TSA30-6]|uniref:hypothetical protein n=1 Tax=Paenibacillus sp. 23TSA30-6 TaxID=2546104 RepID=UPI0017883B0B|nr:hypothetical protein [Paenibacillus sp. 23TSA30-6]MBE0335579.1 hypothetical protein [Paenibacillus sp. 23TSA30-6]
MEELTVTARKLEDMKLMARGNPQKIAEYVVRKREYDDTVDRYFKEQYSGFNFVDLPSEEYVIKAEARAAETGDDADAMRAAILRDRIKYHESQKDVHKDWRRIREELTTKLANGDTITKRDIESVEHLTRQNSSVDNLALYTRVKRELTS